MLGAPALKLLSVTFPDAKIVAVGNKARDLVESMGIRTAGTVRHPARGGAPVHHRSGATGGKLTVAKNLEFACPSCATRAPTSLHFAPGCVGYRRPPFWICTTTTMTASYSGLTPQDLYARLLEIRDSLAARAAERNPYLSNFLQEARHSTAWPSRAVNALVSSRSGSSLPLAPVTRSHFGSNHAFQNG